MEERAYNSLERRALLASPQAGGPKYVTISNIPPPESLGTVIALTAVYMIVNGILPLYNYIAMSFFQNNYGSAFSIWLIVIQLIFVLLILLPYNFIKHYRDTKHDDVFSARYGSVDDNWLFGPNYLKKLMYIAPVGFLFACSMTLSNIGLFEVGAFVHVLLKASVIILVVLGTLFIKRERPTPLIVVCCIGLAGGTTLVSWQAIVASEGAVSGWAVFINLMAVLCEAAQILSLRQACVYLRKMDRNMPSLEIATHRIMVGTLICTIAAFAFETSALNVFPKINGPGWGLILLGGVFTLTFQTTIVALASQTYAITVAVIMQASIIVSLIPSILLPKLFKTFHTSPTMWAGCAVTVVFFFAFGYIRYRMRQSEKGMSPHSVPDGMTKAEAAEVDRYLSSDNSPMRPSGRSIN